MHKCNIFTIWLQCILKSIFTAVIFPLSPRFGNGVDLLDEDDEKNGFPYLLSSFIAMYRP